MKANMRFWMVVFLVLVLTPFSALTDDLTPTEKQIVAEVSKDKTFGHIQKLAQLSPRLVGSGTNADKAIGTDYDVAMYIKSQLESYGLKPWIEEFSFDNWVLYEYKFVIDYDGDFATTKDQVDMTKKVIPSRYSVLWEKQAITLDKTANIVFLSSSNIGNVSGKIVFADTQIESEEKFLDKLWEKGALFNIICRKGSNGGKIHDYRWKLTFSISESDFLSIKSKATASTKVHIIYRIEKAQTKVYNVIAKTVGEDNKEMILVAHYDSVVTQGANDNASGVAALLEVARILSKYKFKHPIYFVFTDGEEQRHEGVTDFLKRHGNDIKDATVLNLDTVGFGEPQDLYVGIGYNVENKSYPPSQDVDGIVSQVTKIITGYDPKPLIVDTTTMDTYEFKVAGIATTNIISLNVPFVHTSLDIPVNVNKDLVDTVTKITAVSTYRLAEGGGLAEPQTPPPTTQTPQQQQTQSPTQTPIPQPQTSPPTTQAPQKTTGVSILFFLFTFLLLSKKTYP